jgi:hypothetical protein
MVGTDEIVRLASGEMEAERVANRIDQGMDFGARPSAGAAGFRRMCPG